MATKEQLTNKGVYFNLLTQNQTGFSKDGYAITSWNTDSKGYGTDYKVGESISIENNLILYAQWGIPGAIDYYDSVEDGNTGITKYYKFYTGRYEVIAIGGAGYNGHTMRPWGNIHYRVGGSSPMLSGICDVNSAIIREVTIGAAYDIQDVQNQFQTYSVAHTIFGGILTAYGGNSAYGLQNIFGSDCHAGTEREYELPITGTFIGWNGPAGIDNEYNVDGSEPANTSFPYGTSAKFTGGHQYGQQYGYLHIERFMEAKYYVEGSQYKETQYVRRTGYSKPPTNPTRKGYVFSGWDPDPRTTVMTRDMRFDAKWDIAYVWKYGETGTGGDKVRDRMKSKGFDWDNKGEFKRSDSQLLPQIESYLERVGRKMEDYLKPNWLMINYDEQGTYNSDNATGWYVCQDI